jgi:hypothetical protein
MSRTGVYYLAAAADKVRSMLIHESLSSTSVHSCYVCMSHRALRGTGLF